MENFIRHFTVVGNTITDSRPIKKGGNVGENNVTSLSFTFSEEWDNAIVSIVFRTPSYKLLTPQTVTNGLVEIPVDALDTSGTLQFSLMGAFADSNKVLRTPTYGLEVEATLNILGGTPLATYTNVVLACQLATTAANTAARTANDAAEDCAQTEQATKDAEALRVTAEQSRVTAESGRVTAEQGRETAEGTRVSSETARGTAEGSRATAENGRTTAETGRVNAESSRVTAEQTRAAFYAGFNAALALKADKAQEAWMNLTLSGGAVGTIKYRKDSLGNVYLNVSLSTAPMATLATLPVGYRPADNFIWIANASSNTVFSRGFIGTDGRLFNNTVNPIYMSVMFSTT
jgi:hypothetical protein